MSQEKNTGIDLYALTIEEFKKKINGFTKEQYDELKARYGNRLRYLRVQVDEEEVHDFLLLRPNKNVILAIAHQRDDINAANELLIANCVVAGDKEALEDGVVYSSVLEAIGGLLKAQGAFTSKA